MLKMKKIEESSGDTEDLDADASSLPEVPKYHYSEASAYDG